MLLICNFAESKGVEISTEAVVCGISFFRSIYGYKELAEKQEEAMNIIATCGDTPSCALIIKRTLEMMTGTISTL